jgi:hypothetical protein
MINIALVWCPHRSVGNALRGVPPCLVHRANTPTNISPALPILVFPTNSRPYPYDVSPPGSPKNIFKILVRVHLPSAPNPEPLAFSST